MPENCNLDSTPLAQSEQIRTPQLFSLNYTNQDFWSMKSRLVDFMRERFADDFNDFVESSLAILLIENWAFLADMLSFKQDQIANEIFIDTVTEIDNAFRLSRLVGFNPTPPIAAKASFSATLGSLLDTDLVMETPVRLRVVANDVPTNFELFPADTNNEPIFDEPIIIPAGSFTNTSIVGVEGQTFNNIFSGTGEQNQSFQLIEFPVLYDTIRVDIDGVRWEEVEYFTDSQPRREYRVEYNSDYQAFIMFGNNRAGAIPPSGAEIQVTYRKGGGTFGNIVSDSVLRQKTFVVSGFDISIPVEFTNYTRAEGGYDGDTIEDIRLKLPPYLRTQNRAVTGTDYKTIADQFTTPYSGQVGKATAVLRNHGCAGNVIDLFVLAKDGGNGLQIATDGLKVALAEELDAKKMITDHVCIKDGSILEVDVIVEVTMDNFFKKFQEEVQARADTRLNAFFRLLNWDYGDDLKDADIVKALADIREIKRTAITFVTADPDNSGNMVTAQYYEIIRPDQITITFSYE